jgi:biotin transport system substrate-specific component
MSQTIALRYTHQISQKSSALSSALTSAAWIVAGSLFIAALSQLAIPLPFTPVPLTGQTLAVLLIGAALGSKRGVAAVALYLAEGAAGLPFFAGGASGLAVLTGATAGYLVGFLAAAFVVGFLCERELDRKLKTAVPVFLLGQLIIYIFGASFLHFAMPTLVTWKMAVTVGVVPFIAGDLLKIVVASSSLPYAWKWVNRKS